jgi:hypothetical protein
MRILECGMLVADHTSQRPLHGVKIHRRDGADLLSAFSPQGQSLSLAFRIPKSAFRIPQLKWSLPIGLKLNLAFSA